MANRAFLTRRRNKRFLSFEGNNRENIVIPDIKKGFVHSLAKFMLAWRSMKEGKQIVSNPCFKNGKKSDLFVLDDAVTYDIIYNDTAEKGLASIQDKDFPFWIEQLSAQNIIEDGLRSWFPNTWVVKKRERKK